MTLLNHIGESGLCFFLFVCFFPSFINALRNLHFNLISTDLDCSSVAFSHNKTVANTISPLFVRKLSMLQNYFTFFFPPLLYCGTEQKLCLALVGNCRRAVKHSVSFECSSQLFVMDQIRSLSWAGIQLQDRCFTVLFIGLATQRVVLHIDRRQVACREKKKIMFLHFFFDCLQILVTYRLQLDVQKDRAGGICAACQPLSLRHKR